MGYSYEGKKLCCDSCPQAGGVRKRKCKYGYCPAPAQCKSCWDKNRDKFRQGCDTHCKPASEKFHALLALQQQMLTEGKFILRWAQNRDDGRVDVGFKSTTEERVVVMTPEEYHKPREGKDALYPLTPEDFGYSSVGVGVGQ